MCCLLANPSEGAVYLSFPRQKHKSAASTSIEFSSDLAKPFPGVQFSLYYY